MVLNNTVEVSEVMVPAYGYVFNNVSFTQLFYILNIRTQDLFVEQVCQEGDNTYFECYRCYKDIPGEKVYCYEVSIEKDNFGRTIVELSLDPETSRAWGEGRVLGRFKVVWERFSKCYRLVKI